MSTSSVRIPSLDVKDRLVTKAKENLNQEQTVTKIEDESISENFRDMTIENREKERGSQIFSYYWASLARMIAIESTDTLCTAIFVHDGTLYYAAKSFDNWDYEKRQQSCNKRKNVLFFLSSLLKTNQDDEQKRKKVLKLTLWIKSRSMIENQIRSQTPSIEKLAGYDQNQPYKDVAAKFSLWKKAFERLPKPPTDFAEIAALQPSADNMRDAVVKMLRRSNRNNKSKIYRDAPRYLEVVLYFYDYLKLAEDVDNYITGSDSHLATGWLAIEKKKVTDYTSHLWHAELAIVQSLLNSQKIEIADLPAIFTAACLAENKKQSPLVASLWNCYGCWNTINCGSEDGVRNLNKEVGVIYLNSEPLLIEEKFVKNIEQRKLLIKLQKCVDANFAKLCEKDVQLIESHTWIQHQDMLY